MRNTFRFLIAGAALATLGACQPTPGYQTTVSPNVQRAAIGAGIGAVAAKALDEDVATGAALGGLAGSLCGDARICAPAPAGY